MRSLWCASGSELEARSQTTRSRSREASLSTRRGHARLSTGLASDDALDDPPLQPLHPVDLEPGVPEVIQGVSHEVVGGEADAERVERSLHRAHGERRARTCSSSTSRPPRPPPGRWPARAPTCDRAPARAPQRGTHLGGRPVGLVEHQQRRLPRIARARDGGQRRLGRSRPRRVEDRRPLTAGVARDLPSHPRLADAVRADERTGARGGPLPARASGAARRRGRSADARP